MKYPVFHFTILLDLAIFFQLRKINLDLYYHIGNYYNSSNLESE